MWAATPSSSAVRKPFDGSLCATAKLHPSKKLCTLDAASKGPANRCGLSASQTGYRKRSIVQSRPKPAPAPARATTQPICSAISGRIQKQAIPVRTPPLKGTMRRERSGISASEIPRTTPISAIEKTKPTKPHTLAKNIVASHPFEGLQLRRLPIAVQPQFARH